MIKSDLSLPVFSENDMADAFQVLASSKKGLPGIGRFWRVFREVASCHGRPDFVCLKRNSSSEHFPFSSKLGLVGASVMASLNGSAGQTLSTIQQKTGYAISSIKTALSQLVIDGFVKKIKNDKFRVVSPMFFGKLETIAFELKLKNVKRALFQAQQYRCFADKVFIVVPPQLVGKFEKHKEVMSLWKIGLASYDPLNNKFCVVIKSQNKKPKTKHQAIYTIMNAISSTTPNDSMAINPTIMV